MKVWPCTCWHWDVCPWSSMGESLWNKMPSVEGERHRLPSSPSMDLTTLGVIGSVAGMQKSTRPAGQNSTLGPVIHVLIWGPTVKSHPVIATKPTAQQGGCPTFPLSYFKRSFGVTAVPTRGKRYEFSVQRQVLRGPLQVAAWSGVWRRGFIEKSHCLSSSYQFLVHLWEGMQLGSGWKCNVAIAHP